MKQIVLPLIILLTLTGCSTTSLPPVTAQNFTFEDDEKRLWLRAEEEQKVINNSGLIYKDETLENYLNEVAKKLNSPTASTYIPFKVVILKNPYLNAFAFPNGVIYLHTGILARMENEAQLATLLAHEMAHPIHRHAVKEYRDIKNKTAFLATLQVTTGGLVFAVGALATLASVSGYSQELETEADLEGIKLMINAGYDPSEAPKLFTHLRKEVEGEKIKEPFFFGTHPRLEERIENYETFLQTIKHTGGIKNTGLFLEKINKVILDNSYLDLKAGRFKIAQRGVEKHLTIKPNDAEAYYLLGEIFRQRGEEGDAEKAKEHYQKAIFINPDYPDPHKGIGLICYKQGDISQAKKFLELYMTLSPKAPDSAYIQEYIKQFNTGGQL